MVINFFSALVFCLCLFSPKLLTAGCAFYRNNSGLGFSGAFYCFLQKSYTAEKYALEICYICHDTSYVTITERSSSVDFHDFDEKCVLLS